jgi:hypothetical protein
VLSATPRQAYAVDSPSLHTPVFTFSDAVRWGFSRHQINRRVTTRAWYSWHRGIYAEAAVVDGMSPRDQHLARVVALLKSRGNSDVASHLSAAAALGWPLPLDGAGEPTVTSQTGSSPTRRRQHTVVQVAGLERSDLMTLPISLAGHRFDVACTRPARTLAALLRHLPIADSVAIGDAALRTGKPLFEGVVAQLDRQQRWPYIERGRKALLLLDPRRESWLESYSFVTLHLAGLPMPEPQVTVRDAQGRFVARVDGWMDEGAVGLEADGRGKYLIGLPTLSQDLDRAADDVAAHVRDRLLHQSVRQRQLEDLGVTVVRWTTGDITAHSQAVAARVSRACREGQARTFTGQVELCPRLVAS